MFVIGTGDGNLFEHFHDHAFGNFASGAYYWRMADDKINDPNHHGMNVSGLRRSATGFVLDREDLGENPFVQFEGWFRYACETVPMDPNAVSISTVDSQNRPSSRTVLLKYFDENGFVFFTNFESKKAAHIENNPNVALLFFWSDAARQVKIRGRAERISAKETLKYFMSRPRGSQIGAWVSAQSSVITSRSLLENKFQEMKKKFSNKEIPLPSFWGGYRVVPEEVEFWQGRRNRLHDRFQYTKQEDGSWAIERLSP
jgi:pyridoxamine 5'-phosphate oxidase